MPDPTAQNPPAAAQDAAQEPPAAPDAHPDTPEVAEGEAGPLPDWERELLERQAAARAAGLCCDLHGRNCEPPSELCCEDCTEARHPFHPPDVACTWASKADVEFGQAVQRLAGNAPDPREARGHCLGCRPVNGERSPIDLPCPVHQAPEAPSDAQGLILGRAWIDAFGGFWLPGEFADVAELEHHFGRTREVLLVRPEIAELAKAAQSWREASKRQGVYAEHVAALAAAVDAATSGHPAANLAVASRGLATDEPAPELASDGPGWDRVEITYLANLLDRAEAGRLGDPPNRQPGDQLRALLADRDRLADQIATLDRWLTQRIPSRWHSGGAPVEIAIAMLSSWSDRGKLATELAEVTTQAEAAYRAMVEAQRERNKARAEAAEAAADRDATGRLNGNLLAKLAEVEAERDRYRLHSTWLNTIAWKVAQALGDVPDGAEQIQGNPLRQVERLIAERDGLRAELVTERGTGRAIARRDGAADALGWAAKETDRRIYDDGDAVAYKLSRLAAEVRSGEREIPTRQDGDAS